MTQQPTSKREEAVKEHIESLLEEGYNIHEIAEIMNHSTEWVMKYIDINYLKKALNN